MRYGVAPRARRLALRWRKLRAERGSFRRVEDLKALAAERGWPYRVAGPRTIQQTVPSKAIPEDGMLLLRQGLALARQHDQYQRMGALVEQLWFANLAAVTRYPLEESFTCEVPDVYIAAPDGAVLSERFEALIQSSRMNWDTVLMARVPRTPPIAGTALSLLGWSAQNYSHWLVDLLPRVALVAERLPELQVLVPGQLKSYHRETLELLGIAPEQQLPLATGWHRLERLLISHQAQRSMLPKREHLLALRDRLADAALGGAPRPAPWRHVYISRARARRKILNEQELLPIMRDYGFEAVACEELSVREQIRLFSETAVLMGPHGSGLNNSVFCPPGGRLLEIYNPLRWNYCVRNVANVLGHEHWYLFGQNVGAEFDMRVDPRKFTKFLSYAFERPELLEQHY
jgi:capsular polysaccharide biosynthesis protein